VFCSSDTPSQQLPLKYADYLIVLCNCKRGRYLQHMSIFTQFWNHIRQLNDGKHKEKQALEGAVFMCLFHVLKCVK
jgi:hypothetical protein